MGAYEHEGLRVDVDDGVAFVTLDHPPVNLFDAVLIGSLWNLAGELADDDGVRAVVIRSADPEFFIAHADLALIQALPRDRHRAARRARVHPRVHGAVAHAAAGDDRTDSKGAPAAAAVSSRSRSTCASVQWAGRSSASPRLPSASCRAAAAPSGSRDSWVGRGRSRPYVGCEDFDAELAERYGWINRALPPAELGPFVERLARRIATFPPHAVRLAKQAVDAAGGPLREGLLDEAHCFNLHARRSRSRRPPRRRARSGGTDAGGRARPSGPDRSSAGAGIAALLPAHFQVEFRRVPGAYVRVHTRQTSREA